MFWGFACTHSLDSLYICKKRQSDLFLVNVVVFIVAISAYRIKFYWIRNDSATIDTDVHCALSTQRTMCMCFETSGVRQTTKEHTNKCVSFHHDSRSLEMIKRPVDANKKHHVLCATNMKRATIHLALAHNSANKVLTKVGH